jgi:phosphatidylserine synthase
LKQVVYYGVSITIVAGAYHFLFFTLLNMVQAKTENQKTGMLVFIFNYVNAVLFVLIFAVLPYLDFKDNMMQPERSYLGFIAHYVSLLCFVATLIFMRRWLMKDNDVKPRALNTVFVSVTIVYVASLELILHVSQAVIGTVKTIADEELWAKADELGIAETHIVKIGFPILWGLLAFVFLFIGMKKQNKSLRIMSLILIGIILLKLAFYDIRDASEIGKILAFIILGVVLLIIAFMYQKIKKLIIDDKPETDRVTDITVPPANDQNDPGIV